jgi:methylamine dehydrogenase heavy chain
MTRMSRTLAASALAAIYLVAASVEDASAEAAIEGDPIGVVLDVPDGPRDHWVWVSDRVLRHSQLFDGDTGRVMGTIDVAWSLSGRLPHESVERNEIYLVESVYARGHRGARTDIVTLYDRKTLAVKGDIEIPPRAAETGAGVALTALLDGGRFLVVYNQTPGSVSVVDLQERRFVGEIDTAGCACVYPTGSESFGMLCGDGTAVKVEIDGTGKLRRMTRSEKFFDVIADPLTEKGVRVSNRWLFSSFEGHLHDVDFEGLSPALRDKWSLFTDAERAAGWRIGGVQHLAMHGASGRLYSLVHEGVAGSHKDPGAAIWVYNLAARAKTEELAAPSLVMPFIRPLLGLEVDSIWYRLLSYAVAQFGSPGVHSIVVTQDASPLLFVRNEDLGALGVMDATSGAHLRDIEEIGISGSTMAVP